MSLPIDPVDTAAIRPATGLPVRAPQSLHGETIDPAGFHALLEQRRVAPVPPGPPRAAGPSLGERLVERAAALGADVQQDHAHVAKALEQAARGGDPVAMMKGMMALGDYQTRTQFIAKAGSKASSAVEQLTKLQ